MRLSPELAARASERAVHNSGDGAAGREGTVIIVLITFQQLRVELKSFVL